MKSFKRFQNRTKILGTTMSERALNQGIRNYNMYLKNAGNQLTLPMTEVGEFLITDKTKKVQCTMRDLKFDDVQNFDEVAITVPITVNVSVGSYAEWQGRTYLFCYQQHKEIPTHKTFVLVFCNTTYHAFGEDGKILEIPMSNHDLTLYSNGEMAGKYETYEDGKVKTLIPNNELTRKVVKIDDRVFISELNTFKVTSIDDYTTMGLLQLVMSQTLNEVEDEVDKLITSQQQEAQDSLISKKTEIPTSKDTILGVGSIKVGQSSSYKLINTELKTISWEIDKNIKNSLSLIENSDLSCTVMIKSNGAIVGDSFNLNCINNSELVSTKRIAIASLF